MITSVFSPVVYEARVDGVLKIVHANKMKRDTAVRYITPPTANPAFFRDLTAADI